MRSNWLIYFGGGAAIAGIALCAGALWVFVALDEAQLDGEGAQFESQMLGTQRDEVKQLQKSPNKNTTVDRIKQQKLLPAQSPE